MISYRSWQYETYVVYIYFNRQNLCLDLPTHFFHFFSDQFTFQRVRIFQKSALKLLKSYFDGESPFLDYFGCMIQCKCIQNENSYLKCIIGKYYINQMSVIDLINKALVKVVTLDSFNPNWEFAKIHGLACSPGIDKSSGTKEHSLCQCCLNEVKKQPVPLCQHSKELQFLGFGFPLYFMFFKYSIILLLILVMTNSIIGLFWATDPNLQNVQISCTGKACPTWLLWVARLQAQVFPAEIVIRFTSFFMHLLGLLYIRNLIQKSMKYLEERSCSLSDFSLIMKRMPQQLGIQRKTREFFKKRFEADLQDIILINQLKEYYQIQKQKHQLIQNNRNNFCQSQNTNHNLQHQKEEFNKKLMELNQMIQTEYQEQKKKIESDEVICNKIIVIVDSQKIKEQILQKFNSMDKSQLREFFEGNTDKISIETAPQPKQIEWQNIDYPRKSKRARLVLGFVLSILTLAAVSAIFYAILQAKGLNQQKAFEQIETDPQSANSILIGVEAGVFCAIFAIILFNKFILSNLFHYFTEIQMHYTGSSKELSFCQKYAFGLFWTTACMTLIVEDARFKNIDKQKWGIIQEESIMFFLTAFFVPLIWLINPWAIIHSIKVRLNFGRTDLTQRQANKLMQKNEYSMGKRYAEIIQQMWFAFLYSSLIPIGPMLLVCGLLIYYWIDKYNLLRRSSVKNNISAKMPLRAIKLLDLTLIFKPLGQIIFDTQIRNGICYESIICISIATVYLLIPIDFILNYFSQEKFHLEENTYTEVKNTFLQTYRTLHPLYRHQRKKIIKSTVLTSGKNLTFLESHQKFNKMIVDI